MSNVLPHDAAAEPILPMLSERARLCELSFELDGRRVTATPDSPQYKVLGAAQLEAEDRWFEYERTIAETPATTLHGILAKLAIAAGDFHGIPDVRELTINEHLLLGAYNDLRAFIAKLA